MTADSSRNTLTSAALPSLDSRAPTPLPSVIVQAWKEVKARKFFVFGIVAVALLVQLACWNILLVKPLTPKMSFIFRIIFAGADAWVIMCVQALALESLQGKSEISFGGIALRAMTYLPKPFLSYVILTKCLSLELMLPPSALLIPLASFMFLMWAPMYCALETYSKDIPKEEIDDDDDMGELSLEPPRFYHLSNKLPWELGFSRSIDLASANFLVSFHFVVLHWFCQVVPRSLVMLLRDHVPELVVHNIELATVQLLDGFVLGAVAFAFLLLLPTSARREIGLEKINTDTLPTREKPEKQSRKRRQPTLRIHLQAIPRRTLALVALCLLSSWTLVKNIEKDGLTPKNVRLEEVALRAQGQDAIVSFWVQDKKHRLRWLEPSKFRLFFGSELIDPKNLREQELADPRYIGFAPDEIEIRNSKDEPVPRNAFRPTLEPLKFILTFRKVFPEAAQAASNKTDLSSTVFYYRGGLKRAELQHTIPVER